MTDGTKTKLGKCIDVAKWVGPLLFFIATFILALGASMAKGDHEARMTAVECESKDTKAVCKKILDKLGGIENRLSVIETNVTWLTRGRREKTP